MHRIDDIRIKVLNPAVEKGDLELVKKIIRDYKELNLKPNATTIQKAIISDKIALLQYFEDTFSISPAHLSPDQLNETIRNIKSYEMLNHLLTKYSGLRFGMNTATTEIVARSGNIENLKLLLSRRIPYADSVTLYAAVRSKNIECVRFLVEEYKVDGKQVITDFDECIELADNIKLDAIAAYLREKKKQLTPTQEVDLVSKSVGVEFSQPSTKSAVPQPTVNRDKLPITTVIAQPFIASPVHSEPLPSSKNTDVKFFVTLERVQIIFEKSTDTLNWRLGVFKNEKKLVGDDYIDNYAMLFENKESINKIQQYLKENNISGLINYLEDDKGVSASSIAKYLRAELNLADSNKLKK